MLCLTRAPNGAEEANTKERGPVQIHLEGENVGDGEVRLDALAGFIEGLQSSLRRLALLRVGRKALAAGRLPEPLRQAVDLRLVGFGKGSATLLVKPGTEDTWGSPAADVLDDLAGRLARPEREWDPGVADAVEMARRGLGKGGRFSIQADGVRATVDEATTARLRELATRAPSAEGRQAVSGWLHMADLQPNEVVIKTPLGVEWRCRFSPEMKPRILSLLDQVVVAQGSGTLKDWTGELVIEEIRSGMPEAYQLTIDRDFEAVIEERIRSALPRQHFERRAPEGPKITERDIEGLMRAVEELNE